MLQAFIAALEANMNNEAETALEDLLAGNAAAMKALAERVCAPPPAEA